MEQDREDRGDPYTHDRADHPVETLFDRLDEHVESSIDAIEPVAHLFEGAFQMSQTNIDRVRVHVPLISETAFDS
jgi:hypothetical protein